MPSWLPDYDPTGHYQITDFPPAPGYQLPDYAQPPAATDTGTTNGTGQTPTVDWRRWLEDWGFPPEVVNELDRIFRTDPDTARAAANALAYVRGTDWYRQTFPGIDNARRVGLIRDERDYERDYRAYVNEVNQLYRQQYGRDVTNDEIVRYLGEGVNLDIIGRRLAGEAYIGANRGDLQYLAGAFGEGRLSEEQLTALGRQQAGLGSLLGADLLRRIGMAEQRLRRVFEGQLASPSLSLGPAGLSAPSLDRLGAPDIGR